MTEQDSETPETRPDIRASDADREKVATTLRDHFSEGRLTFEELQDRLEQVYAATTIGELQPLTRDLPEVPAATPHRAVATPGEREEFLRKRLANRIATYIVLMAFLVLIWAVSGRHGSFWPVWPILIGGFILAMNVLGIERGRERRRLRYERYLERRGQLGGRGLPRGDEPNEANK